MGSSFSILSSMSSTASIAAAGGSVLARVTFRVAAAMCHRFVQGMIARVNWAMRKWNSQRGL